MRENPDYSGDRRNEKIRKALIVANIWAATGGGLYIYDDLTSGPPRKDKVENVAPPVPSSPNIPQAPAVTPCPSLPSAAPFVPTPHPSVLEIPSVPQEPVELTRDEIAQKILKSLIIVELRHEEKRPWAIGLCTGFVYGPHTFLTARHCPGISTTDDGGIHAQLPDIFSIHEYPYDSQKLMAIHSRPQSNGFSFFKGDSQTYVPDIVKGELNTEVFSDRVPLEKASKAPVEGDTLYTVHFIGKSDTRVPLGQWNWYVEGGFYVDQQNVNMPTGEKFKSYIMKMDNIQQGNSGSPVVNKYGQAIGVVSFSTRNSNDIGVAPFSF